jgi:hypothetical protein
MAKTHSVVPARESLEEGVEVYHERGIRKNGN